MFSHSLKQHIVRLSFRLYSSEASQCKLTCVKNYHHLHSDHYTNTLPSVLTGKSLLVFFCFIWIQSVFPSGLFMITFWEKQLVGVKSQEHKSTVLTTQLKNTDESHSYWMRIRGSVALSIILLPTLTVDLPEHPSISVNDHQQQ